MPRALRAFSTFSAADHIGDPDDIHPRNKLDVGLRLARWALPDDVVLIEAVPKTSVGKFDKKVLRERFKSWQPKR